MSIEYGIIMAKYYINVETIINIKEMKSRASIREVVCLEFTHLVAIFRQL